MAVTDFIDFCHILILKLLRHLCVDLESDTGLNKKKREPYRLNIHFIPDIMSTNLLY